MGRPPKPIALHKLEGTYRPDRHGSALMVEPSGKVPAAPRWMSAGARRIWRRLAPQLHAAGLLTGIDVAAFAALCAIQAEVEELRAIEDPSPALTRYRYRMEREFLKWARMFGMTPASRIAR